MKDKKGITIINAFPKIWKESNRKPNKIWVDKGSEICSRSWMQKPLCIRFHKVDGIIKIYDEIRYLELSDSYKEVFHEIESRKYNAIFDRINYL